MLLNLHLTPYIFCLQKKEEKEHDENNTCMLKLFNVQSLTHSVYGMSIYAVYKI